MTDATIHAVDGYANVTAIRAALRAALASHEGIADMLCNDDPARLVVVKPNWVQESHEYEPSIWEPVVTHPSVVRAVVDELAEMMRGKGTVCVCDAPHTYASFDSIVARGELKQRLWETQSKWPKLKLELLDLRRQVWTRREEVVVERRSNRHDPRGYTRLNLGPDSLFYGLSDRKRFYGADYDSRVVNEHHNGEIQEYLLAGTPMQCDLFVNVPKLKTHKKTGITCCLKNLVGVNGDKNWLPHHTEGSTKDGGDEFPTDGVHQRLERSVKRFGRRLMRTLPMVGQWTYRRLRSTGKRILGDSETVVRNGNWSGNDTCWRMALDLNRALLYGNADGSWREGWEPKQYLAIVDGIIGGQGNGPICPDAVASGALITGTNPATVDAIASRLMGFDPESLPIVKHAFDSHRWPIANRSMNEIRVRDERVRETISLCTVQPAVPGGFEPHFGWKSLKKAA